MQKLRKCLMLAGRQYWQGVS